MWIVTTNGFVSVVEDRADPDLLQVRARVPEDITATIPGAKVFTLPGSDYRYRARVNRQSVARVVAKAVRDIDYTSHFKDAAIAASPPNPERYSAYYGTWTALAEMQDYAPYSVTPRPARPRWEDEDDFFTREETR